MISNMIKTIRFWIFVAMFIATVVFTSIGLCDWPEALGMLVGAIVTLRLIGRKRAAARASNGT